MKNEVRPVAEPLAGVRLVRGRPWALAATVLAVFLLQIGPTTFWSVLLDRAMETGGLLLSLVQPLGLALLELPTVGALTVVAVLSGRRVTVGRVLALWVLSVLVWLAALLVGGVAGGTGGWLVLVAVLAQAVKLVVLGLLAGGLFPAAGGERGPVALLAASVALPVFLLAVARVPIPWVPMVLGAAGIVGWSVAALVTSRPGAESPARTPAEQGRQDP
ncbi:hypothetical protein [Actinoplanes xinjiangensis]|uniref:Uncharacterized protein n=1 Tax=Actinoplanes xinjiangensis TaxID=512350 RepID=A0A316FCT1_9ACTN|nr:hypothetical protein [Actinoplanes xinjiangensis]PWK46698.1 hypothetical protein BC793_109269 [Actinoplanes xinjiangensis]GIF40479.1 hypothetical protein Axi01nite_47900 [Actinoplanes xinjiangensis]